MIGVLSDDSILLAQTDTMSIHPMTRTPNGHEVMNAFSASGLVQASA